MFATLGRFTYRRRRWILAAAVAFLAFAGVWGTGVIGVLTSEQSGDPDSESARAAVVAAAALGRDDADVVVLWTSPDRTVEDPAFRRTVTSILAALPAEHVERRVSWFDTGAPGLVSADRRSTYAVLGLRGADETERENALEAIEDRLDAPGLETRVGGTVTVGRDITQRVGEDIARAEMLSIPVLLVLLVLVFGGVVAAGLPLAIGVLAVLGAFTALRLATMVTEVSVFSLNVVTILGLGLAIDYGLFIVGRFREELGRGRTPYDAVVVTMNTAGRTVAVSGLTVAVALAGLLVFPQVFLRSMGLGGIAAVLVAVVAALTVLPALLSVLGHRVDALPVRRRARTRPYAGVESGAWSRLAHSVMRRPVLYATGVVAVLLALGTPFLGVAFGGIDARALPAGTESRQVAEAVERDFPGGGTSPVVAVLTGADPAEVARWTATAQALDGVTGATVTGQAGGTARVSLTYAGNAQSDAARDLVDRVRALPAPPGGAVLVGGSTAELDDLLSGLGRLLPVMALIVAGSTFVLLFLAFGSVVLPLKALAINVLSLTASFGAVVWIFQDGNLSGLLAFTPTGTLEATQPILVLAIVFGLSTDYEVFLMSRIREEYLRTGDDTAAVAAGLQRTGGIVTSAGFLSGNHASVRASTSIWMAGDT